MSASWKLLPVSSQTSDRPPLLVSSVFTPNSYTIQITDLTFLWTESLDRRGILKCSFNEADTAIDPSEDAEQMGMLLQKIEGGIRGDEGTEITLEHDPTSTRDAPKLILHVSANLPKPLRPLKWPVHLSRCDATTFTEKVTMPLLAAQNARIQEMESLMEALKDKDHVIQKLVDRLEASGTDLGQIFPIALAKGSKKTTRTKAAARVKGLGVFEQPQWKIEMAKKSSGNDLNQLAAGVFGTERGLEISDGNENSIPGKWKTWWESSNHTTPKTTVSSPPSSAKSSNEDDGNHIGNLQVQSTPLQYSQNSNKRSSATLDDDLTEDEDTDDDLDAPSQRSAILVPDSYPIPDSLPSSAPIKAESKGGRLGVIGRPKTVVKRSPTPELNENDDETTDEDEPMNSSPPPSSPPKPKIATPVKSKTGGLGRIGVIGGRKRVASPKPDSPDPASNFDRVQSQEDSPEPQKKSTKLGVIGHKARLPSPGVQGEIRGRSPLAKKDKSPPRETSEERVLRRRREIQKDLEEKAKKPPVKKKRKF